MNKLIVITHFNNLGENHTWVGQADQPDTSLVDVDQHSFIGARCHIDPTDEDKMYVAGSTNINQVLRYSLTGGTLWGTAAGLGAEPDSPVRQLKGVGGDVVWMCDENKLYKSVNSAQNWAAATGIPVDADVYADFHFADAAKGILAKNFVGGSAVGGLLYRTTDGGTTWSSPVFSLQSAGTPIAAESIRRVLAVDATLDRLFLLTSHRVLELNWNGALYIDTILWDFSQVLLSTYGFALASTGYQGGVDLKPYFDDMFYDPTTGRMFLAGASRLKARSLDLTTFTISDPATVTAVTEAYFHRCWFINGSTGLFTGSFETPPVGLERSGLYKTVNAGGTFGQSYPLPDKHSARHVWGLFTTPVFGCTNTEACNYDVNATVDNGTCQVPVLLTNCDDPLVTLHVGTPEISALSCHSPRFMIDVSFLDPDEPNQLVTFFVEGVLQFQTSFSVSQALSGAERLAQFLGELVAWINANTFFTAALVPPLQNILVPNSLGGIWIECADNTCAGQQANISTFGTSLGGVTQQNAFDSGTIGATIRLTEYPGCWKVCGEGDCSQAQQLTLLAAYEDCFRCVPNVPSAICRDCDSLVFIGSTPLVSTLTDIHANCIAAGQILDFDLDVTFQTREPETFIPVEAGNACSGISPISLTFPGNQILTMPVGMQFTVNDSGSVYTVATSFYDQGENTTLITSIETCQDTEPILSITTYTNCDCGVNVQIENVATSNIIFNQNFPCVGSVVDTEFSYQIVEYGKYKVTITASDCASSRTCTYWLDSCDQYKVEPSGCHTWKISLLRPPGSPSTGSTASITVTDLATGTVALQLADVPDSEFPKTFTGTVDTVYLIEVTSSDGTTWTEEVVDLCDFKACRRRMTLDLFCGEDDPCENDCARTEEREQLRAELTRLQLLQSDLEAEMYSYRTRWAGLPQYEAERRTSLEVIARLVDTIRRLSLRCGICESTTTTNTVSECRSC